MVEKIPGGGYSNLGLKTMKKAWLITLGISIFLLINHGVWAAEVPGLGMAEAYTIADQKAVDGDILAHTAAGLVRSTGTYDGNMFGVLSDNSDVVMYSGTPGDRPVIRSGTVRVNVNGSNGPISVGDYVTTSGVPGQGMKASQSGNVLGVAVESFTGSGQGRIMVAVQPQYAELTIPRPANQFFEFLGSSLLSNVKDPEKLGVVVRYLLAALVLLMSLIFGFFTFSRAIPKGIEAIGRNPLARNTIFLSMVLNVVLIAIVGILGVVGALLIIRL